MTLAALRLPAGKAIPILSNLSLRFLPPSFDLALEINKKIESSHVMLDFYFLSIPKLDPTGG